MCIRDRIIGNETVRAEFNGKTADKRNDRFYLLSLIHISFIYGDLAAMLTKSAADYYSLWYFIYEDGKWKCTGEDIGGDSVKDAEITFREKADVYKRQQKRIANKRTFLSNLIKPCSEQTVKH